jgi:C1A family cysteine protease
MFYLLKFKKQKDAPKIRFESSNSTIRINKRNLHCKIEVCYEVNFSTFHSYPSGGYNDMHIQKLKNKKLSNIISRSCIYLALLIMLLYPACAGSSELNLQSRLNSEFPEFPDNLGNLTPYYYDMDGNLVTINLSLQMASLDPAFLDYLKHPEKWESHHYDEDGNLRTLGIIPSPNSVYWPENYSYYSYNPEPEASPNSFSIPSIESAGQYPAESSGTESTGQYPAESSDTGSTGQYPAESYFSLVDEGRVTPVKDQGSAGACWTFASLASLESYLTPVDALQWDFSENNMKNLLSEDYSEGFDRTHDAGGNTWQSAAYLTRWNGPVIESDDPYNPSSGVSPTNKSVQKHVQEIVILPPRSNATDNNLIKKMVKEKGGVYGSIVVDWNCFGSKDGYKWVTYYNPVLSSSDANGHSVCIIGWNDNLSRNEFNSTPPGNGAFICKNSWGTGNGINGSGYFYISYYDANLGTKDSKFPTLAVYTAKSPNNYENSYQYDPLGWTSSVGYKDLTYSWAANVFTAKSNEELKAIGFYTPMPDINYKVYVYSDPSLPSVKGTPIFNTSGSFELPGYHTIELEQKVPLKAGQNFSIVMNISSSSESYVKFPAEYNINGYSSKARANPGESYLSPDGTAWADLTSYYPASNFCIKAYTSTPDTQKPVINSVGLNNTAPNAGALIRVSVNTTDNVAVSSVEASGSLLTHLSGDIWEGTITAISGKHSVNVSARDNAGNLAWNNSTSYTATTNSYTATTNDTQKPLVNSVSLNDTTPNTGDLIKVSVNATDNVAVDSVEASGSPLTYLSGDTWEGTKKAISGKHSLNVSARDNAGNLAWNNSTSYTATTPDTQKPVINSVTLNNTTPNAGDVINVSVSSTDNVAVSSVEASGSLLKHLSGAIWEGKIAAISGTHSVNVLAKDAAGNLAWNNSTSYTAPTKDTELPKINSVSSYPVNMASGSIINVTINATDNIGVVNVTVNGILLTKNKSRDLWEGQIKAPSKVGNYAIPVVILDAAGNKKESSFPCHVLRLKGKTYVSMNPASKSVKKGTTASIGIRIKNNQNIDETFKVKVEGDTLKSSRGTYTFLSFSWTEKILSLRAGEETTLPLEVKVSAKASGTQRLKASVYSTFSGSSWSTRGSLLVR